MLKAFLFAGAAALGNGLFVYGQRSAPVSTNPFLFTAGASTVCSLLFIAAVFVFQRGQEMAYLQENSRLIVASGVGFFVTFFGFFLMYRYGGASIYTVYAVLSILTTAIGVGVVIMNEPFNVWHIASMATAVATVLLFGIGQMKV